MARPPVTPPTREVLRAYLEAIALAEPVQMELWESAHVTLAQLAALRKLRHGPLRPSQLGQALGRSPASVTRILDRLEERGLTSRHHSSSDRRHVEVQLEQEGWRIVNEGIRPLQGSALCRAVESMSDRERLLLLDGLGTLITRTHELSRGQEGHDIEEVKPG